MPRHRIAIPSVPTPTVPIPTIPRPTPVRRRSSVLNNIRPPSYKKAAYRNIPVSTLGVFQSDQADNKTHIDLLSEFLANRGRYVDSVHRPSKVANIEELLNVNQKTINGIRTAPPEKQENAKKSMGGHLKWFGKQLLNIMSVPGEQAAAAIIYGIQQAIPGEQHFEKMVRLQREKETPGAGKWDIQFGMKALKAKPFYKIARDEGMGVPWWYTLPLEVVFDPLNILLTPAVGLALQSAKVGAKVGSRGVRAAGLSGRTVTLASAEMIAAKYGSPLWEPIAFTPDPEMAKWWKMGAGGGPTGLSKELRATLGEGEELTSIGRHPTAYGSRTTGRAGTDIGPEEHVLARGFPHRESLKALITEAEQLAYSKTALPLVGKNKFGTQVKDMDVWVLKALYHLGIRPFELQQLSVKNLRAYLYDDAGQRIGKDASQPRIEIEVPGEKVTKTKKKAVVAISIRRIDDEAADFIDEFLKARPGLTPSTDVTKSAFFLTDEAGNFITEAAKTTRHLNDLVKELAVYTGNKWSHLKSGSDELTQFYTNTSYVFRLSKANDVFSEGITSGGVSLKGGNPRHVMEVLGHKSPKNTVLYLASSHFSDVPIRDYFTQGDFGTKIDDVSRVLHREIEKLTGVAPVDDLLFTPIRHVKSKKKGAQPAEHVKVQELITAARTVVLKLKLWDDIKPEDYPDWVKKSGADSKAQKAMAQLEELFNFTIGLEHLGFEKSFIRGAHAGSKARQAAALKEVYLINDWTKPILDTFEEFSGIVRPSKLADRLPAYEGFFELLGIAELKKLFSIQKGGTAFYVAGRATTKVLSSLEHGGKSRWVVGKAGEKDLWIVEDGGWEYGPAQFLGLGPREITGVRINKLASKARQGNEWVLAKGDVQSDVIPFSDFPLWRIRVPEPIPRTLLRQSGLSGRAGLTPKELAQIMFNKGVEANTEGSMTFMRTILGGMQKAPSKKVLTYANETTGKKSLLEFMPGKKGGTYRFTTEVGEELAALRKVSTGGDEAFGWDNALLQHSSANPPPPFKGTGPGTPGWFPDDWHPMWVPDGKGGKEFISIGDLIQHPMGMNQLRRQWADGKLATWWWQKVVSRVPGAHKIVSHLFGNGFVFNKGAKESWTRMMGAYEAERIAVGVSSVLSSMPKHFGYGVGDSASTGAAMNGISHNVNVAPEVMDAINKGDFETFDIAHVRGMNKKLVQFRDDTYKGIWTQERTDKYLRDTWSYEDEMRRITTILETPKENLEKFYTHTDKNGVVIRGLNERQQEMYDWYHMIDPALWELMNARNIDIKALLKGSLKGGEQDITFVPHLYNNTRGLRGVEGVDPPFTPIGAFPTQFRKRTYWKMIVAELDVEAELVAKKFKRIPGTEILKESDLVDTMVPNKISKIRGSDLFFQDPVKAMQSQVESYYKYMLDLEYQQAMENLGVSKMMQKTITKTGNTIIEAREAGTVADLTRTDKDHAIKWYGQDWETMSMEDLGMMRKKYQVMSDEWRKVGTSEIVTTPGLRGTVLPEDAQTELLALFGDIFVKPSKWMSVPGAFSNTVRLLATGVDLGVLFLHGMGGIGTMFNPIPTAGYGLKGQARWAWATGAKQMFKALADPEVRTLWMAEKFKVLSDMADHNVSFMSRAIMEDMPVLPVGRLGRVAAKFPGVEKAINIAGRPMEGFGFFLDVSKVEMWEAMAPAIRNQQVGGVAKAASDITLDLTEFAASLNAVHGTLNPAVAGIRYKQRIFESAFLMYASLFRRASIALLFDMRSGNKWRRNTAIRSVTGMMMAAGALGASVQASGLNDNFFEPDSPDFLSVKVGPMRMGLGTPFYSLARLGESLVRDAKTDPKGLGEFSITDHAVLRFLRSQTSPFTGLITDLIQGRSFVGDPLRDTDGGWETGNLSQHFVRQFAPFWVENIAEQSGLARLSALAEVFGFRSSPISAWSQVRDMRNTLLATDDNPEIARWRRSQISKGLPITASAAPVVLLKYLSKKFPELKSLEDENKAQLNVRLRKGDLEKREYIDNVEEARAEADTKLTGIARDFEAGRISGQDFRVAMKMVETELRGRNMQLAKDFEEVVETFDADRIGRIDNPEDQFVMDLWYDRFREEVTSNEDIHDKFGNFIPDTYARLQADFKAQLPSTMFWDYIEERRRMNRNEPRTVKELYSARKTLTPFWEAAKDLYGEGSYQVEMLEDYHDAPTEEARRLLIARTPGLSAWLRRLADRRMQLRKTNPEWDALLVRFYDYSPQTPLGEKARQVRQLQALNR